MQETKSISFSNLQEELKWLLGAGAALPPCSFCTALALEGQQGCAGTDLGRVGFTLSVPCAAEMEPGDPSALLGLCQGCSATSSSRLQMPSLHSVFPSLHRPCENASKQQLLRAVEHLQTQGTQWL